MTDNNHDVPDDRRIDEAEIEWFDPWSSRLGFEKAPVLPEIPDLSEEQ